MYVPFLISQLSRFYQNSYRILHQLGDSFHLNYFKSLFFLKYQLIK